MTIRPYVRGKFFFLLITPMFLPFSLPSPFSITRFSFLLEYTISITRTSLLGLVKSIYYLNNTIKASYQFIWGFFHIKSSNLLNSARNRFINLKEAIPMFYVKEVNKRNTWEIGQGIDKIRNKYISWPFALKNNKNQTKQTKK